MRCSQIDGGGDAEGEAAAAGGDAADKRAEPENGDACRSGRPAIIASADVEDEDEADRDHGGEADR